MENEERLMTIAKEITEMKNTILGIVGKVGELKTRIDDSNVSDYEFFKNWFERTVGHELNVARDALEIRSVLVDYLKSKNIEVVDENQLHMEQYGFKSSNEYFENWNKDNGTIHIDGRKR